MKNTTQYQFQNNAPYHTYIRKVLPVSNIVVQLAKDILYVYDYYDLELNSHIIPSMRMSQLSKIIWEILNEEYKLSNLKYFYYDIENFDDLSKAEEQHLDYLYKHIHVNLSDENYNETGFEITYMVITVPTNRMDVLVLIGLSVTLHRILYGSLPTNSLLLDSRYPSFVNTLEELQNVERMYRICLDVNTPLISVVDILSVIKEYIDSSGYLYRLIKEILYLTAYNDEGVQLSTIIESAFPPIAEISYLLFEMIARDRFDKAFIEEFPNLRFYRFKEEVYITCKNNIEFNDNIAQSFLEKIGLSGGISSMQRGMGYLECGPRGGVTLYSAEARDILVIMTSGRVVVRKKWAFYH